MRSIRLTVPILLVPLLLLALAMARGETWVETLGLPFGQPSDEEAEKLRAVEREEAAALVAALREAREGKELLARNGEWSSGRFAAEPSSWQVQIERDRETNAIRGSIQVSGSYPLAHAARIDGTLDEGSVSGRILDAEGSPLGTFTGTATAGGMSGAYATWDGDQGAWAYRDPKPEPVPAHLREAEAQLGPGN